jgi:hypothetical protein
LTFDTSMSGPGAVKVGSPLYFSTFVFTASGTGELLLPPPDPVSLVEPVLHAAASSMATTARIPTPRKPLNLCTKSNLPESIPR